MGAQTLARVCLVASHRSTGGIPSKPLRQADSQELGDSLVGRVTTNAQISNSGSPTLGGRVCVLY
ncbi:MAG: hypothetical protein LZF62_320116 [Nitrospira sp.]|nr:MAG: hypothetical protein LZF62_320116 [Nitrospira sp.]